MSDGRSNKQIFYYHSSFLFFDLSKITGANSKNFIRFAFLRIDLQLLGYKFAGRIIKDENK